jgi:hypothetical protein
MPLTGSQLNRIHHAVLGAYTRDELKRTLRICMDASFDEYAPEKGFADQVWALLEWAVRQDRVKDLVRCAHEHNATNLELDALWRDAQAWDWTRQAPRDVDSSAAAPGHDTATVTGSGASAVQGGVAAGAGGIAIGGNFTGTIIIGGTPPSDAGPAAERGSAEPGTQQ